LIKIIHNFIEDQLKKPTLFIDESKLDINFVPEDLPHREKELILLSQLFLILITQPNSASRKVLITGGIGIGKTVTVKHFGQIIKSTAEKRNIQIEYFHINCRKERTGYKILVKIMKHFNKNFPSRGFSFQDLLDMLKDNLNRQNKHLILVLDELSYIIMKNDDIIYALTRINDEMLNTSQRLSIIGIIRDISSLNNLDESTLSTLQSNIIHFNKYSKNQIIDILKSRVKISIKPNVIDYNIIDMISNLVYKSGDMRKALDILWASIKIAEERNSKKVSPECVRLANNKATSNFSQDLLISIESHKLILLFSILNVLEKNKKSYGLISKIKEEFQQICEYLKLSIFSYSQIMNYLHELEKYGIISIKIKSKNIRGRQAQVSINDISLELLKKKLLSIFESRGLNI